MLFFVLLVIILFLYFREVDLCGVLLVILIIVYALCLINVTGIPTNLLASKEKIEEKKEYIMSLPKLPMSIANKQSDASIVEVDVMNSNLVIDILSAKFDIYSEIREYNRCIYFWQENLKFAFFIWGWPNPSKKIKELDLKPIAF